MLPPAPTEPEDSLARYQMLFSWLKAKFNIPTANDPARWQQEFLRITQSIRQKIADLPEMEEIPSQELDYCAFYLVLQNQSELITISTELLKKICDPKYAPFISLPSFFEDNNQTAKEEKEIKQQIEDFFSKWHAFIDKSSSNIKKVFMTEIDEFLIEFDSNDISNFNEDRFEQTDFDYGENIGETISQKHLKAETTRYDVISINPQYHYAKKLRDFFLHNKDNQKPKYDFFDYAFLPSNDIGKNIDLLTPLQAKIIAIMISEKKPNSYHDLCRTLHYSENEIKDALLILNQMQALIQFECYPLPEKKELKSFDTFSFFWNEFSTPINELQHQISLLIKSTHLTIQQIQEKLPHYTYLEVKNEIWTLLHLDIIRPIYERGQKKIPFLLTQYRNFRPIFYMTHYGLTVEEYWMDINEKYRYGEFPISPTLPTLASFSTSNFHMNLENIERLQIQEREIIQALNCPDIITRIKINSQGNITQLDLTNLELNQLPMQLESLPFLEKITLDANNFKTISMIPLAHLQELSIIGELLEINKLEKEYPELKRLRFSTSKLDFSVIAHNFPNLEELEIIKSTDQNWTKLNQFTQLTKLTLMYIGISNINTLPCLPKLKELILDHNNLSTIPGIIQTYQSLEKLSLKHNLLTSIGVGKLGLPRLKELDLSFNNIEEITDVIQYYSNLKSLDISNNSIRRVSSLLMENEHLELLNLDHNYITSEFMTLEFHKLRHIQYLSVNHNFIAMMPESFRNNSLQSLELEYNALNILPEKISLPNLELLYLTRNAFNTLPQKLNLPNLISLDLTDNIISSISPHLVGYSQIQFLILNQNRFPTIPVEFQQFTSLHFLSLSNNQIKQIPELKNIFNQLHTLMLDNNQITQIENLYPLSHLEELFLNGNQLRELSPDIENMQNLQVLSIENNKFSALPYEITHLQNLRTINGGDNTWLNEWASAIRILNQESLENFRSFVMKIKIWLEPQEIMKNLSRNIPFPIQDRDYNIMAKESVLRWWWESHRSQLSSINNDAANQFLQWLMQYETFIDGKWTHP